MMKFGDKTSIINRGAKYYDDRVWVFACVSVRVCLPESSSPELYIRSSLILCMLPIAEAWPSSVVALRCCVLPVLWMTLCLCIMARNKRHKKHILKSDSTWGSTDSTALRRLKLAKHGAHWRSQDLEVGHRGSGERKSPSGVQGLVGGSGGA